MKICTLVLLTLFPGLARAEVFDFPIPSDDRWHYPFNFTPGDRAVGSCFGTTGYEGFNNRDGYIVVAWNTGAQICPGLGPQAYEIESITVTLTNRSGAEWPVDATVDDWSTYAGEADSDPGRPIELFGSGFGPVYDEGTWTEHSIFVGASGDVVTARDPFPFVYQEGTANKLHVEDNVSGLHNEPVTPPVCAAPGGVCPFTPIPWAVGVPIAYASDAPFDIEFAVDLSLSNGRVKRYFQDQLDRGRVFVIVASLRETEFQGPQSGYPSFFMKEALALDSAAKAPALRLRVMVHPSGDYDGDGRVTLLDWAEMAMCLGGPEARLDSGSELSVDECLCGYDFDGDGNIDLADVATFQRLFTDG